MNKYIHNILQKYNKELKRYSPVINKDGTTDREKHFEVLKPQIKEEFKKYDKPLLLIHKDEDYKQKEQNIIAFNNFNIYYKHDGYNSRADVFVTNVTTLKPISLSVNCKIIDMFNNDLTLIKAIQLIWEK